MKSAIAVAKAKQQIPWIARVGLIAKGMVYVILGTIALLSALDIRQQSGDTDKTGALMAMENSISGHWLLPLLAVGLCCYSLWRFIQVYQLSKNMHGKWKKAVRYFFSGAIYLVMGYTAMQIFFHKHNDQGDTEQKFAATILSQPFGQLLLGIGAVMIGAIGIYQVIYGFSGQYNKHVQKMNLHSAKSNILLSSAVIGYPARGIVWLIIAYLMFKAASSGSSSKAGDTGKAFDFIENVWGSPMLAVMAAGLMAYGLFNFVRARYEQLEK